MTAGTGSSTTAMLNWKVRRTPEFLKKKKKKNSDRQNNLFQMFYSYIDVFIGENVFADNSNSSKILLH